MTRFIYSIALPLMITASALASSAACGRIGYSVEQDPDTIGSLVDAATAIPDAMSAADGATARDASMPTSTSGDAQTRADASCPQAVPLALSQAADTEDVAASISSFNSACLDCAFSSMQAFTYSPCASPGPELADAVAATLAASTLQLSPDVGELLPAADVILTSPLSNTQASQKLLEDISAITGSQVSGGWYYSEQVPCQNCTQGNTVHVLWYRDTQWTVILQGTWFWDS